MAVPGKRSDAITTRWSFNPRGIATGENQLDPFSRRLMLLAIRL